MTRVLWWFSLWQSLPSSLFEFSFWHSSVFTWCHKSSFEGLQCQSDDPRHAAVERLIFQAHQTVEGQRSSSHYSSDPRLIKPAIILGAQINQDLNKREQEEGEKLIHIHRCTFTSLNLLIFKDDLPLGSSSVGSLLGCSTPSGKSLWLGWLAVKTLSLQDKLWEQTKTNH